MARKSELQPKGKRSLSMFRHWRVLVALLILTVLSPATGRAASNKKTALDKLYTSPSTHPTHKRFLAKYIAQRDTRQAMKAKREVRRKKTKLQKAR